MHQLHERGLHCLVANDRASRVLLLRILGVIGAASLSGCAVRNVGDGDEGAEGESGADTQTEADEDGEGEGESGPISDVLVPNDTGDETESESDSGDPTGGDQCGAFIDSWTIDFEPPGTCDYDEAWGYAYVCFNPPAGTSCDDEPYSAECILDAYSCGLISGGDEIACGPYTTLEGACCYVVNGDCAVGRPFCVDGRARVAAIASGLGWSEAPRPELATLDAITRAALADAWRRHGQSEHASVASFARFTAQLLALGAPARLIAAALHAGEDERRHALRCFGLANAYASAPNRPGALDVRECLSAVDPIAIAQSLASEGCVAETVSLMLLIAARDHAEDRAVRAVLSEMIEDERRHVLLAWDALAWLCGRFGAQVQPAVARVFAEAERHVGFGATTVIAGVAASMRAHGYLSIEERRTVAVAALRELVLPAARAVAVGYGTITPSASV